MYLRPVRKKRPSGKIEQTWALVESVRTKPGPRQRVVSYLGNLAEEVRQGVRQAAAGKPADQPSLFPEEGAPQWVEVDLHRLRVERAVQFGGPWLGQAVLDLLHLPDVLTAALPCGQYRDSRESRERYWGHHTTLLFDKH